MSKASRCSRAGTKQKTGDKPPIMFATASARRKIAAAQKARRAKLKAGQLGREAPSACLQYWGGMGYMNETPVSRAFRDSRLASIGGGADEVMLTILCKGMGTLPGMGQ